MSSASFWYKTSKLRIEILCFSSASLEFSTESREDLKLFLEFNRTNAYERKLCMFLIYLFGYCLPRVLTAASSGANHSRMWGRQANFIISPKEGDPVHQRRKEEEN